MRFYEPETFRTQHKSNRQASNPEDLINPSMSDGSSLLPRSVNTAKDAIISHHQMSLCLYNKLIDRGVCREQARGILPQNLYTEYYGTTNLNNLLKFVNLRSHEGAQWEIQKVAFACLAIAKDLWPMAIEAYEIHKS
jgi:thymidylate synthase (FAD)